MPYLDEVKESKIAALSQQYQREFFSVGIHEQILIYAKPKKGQRGKSISVIDRGGP
jgi:transketolase C-terminal domain/subunit